jgi:chromosome segregation ATPase
MVPELPVLERTLMRDVDAALEPLRRKQRDLQTFMASQLERLELQAAEIERRELELAETRELLAKERAALDEEWAHFDQLVETARAHALEVRQEKQRVESLLRQRGETEHQAELLRLQDSLDQAEREKAVLEEELASLQGRIGQAADLALELNDARSELERLRREAASAAANSDAAWQAKLAACETERDRAAADLQEIRRQLTEAARERESERRRFAEERGEWLAEIRSLRRSWSPPPPESFADPPKSPDDSGGSPSTEAHALDDVLSQFEAVKRGVHRHRPNNK